MLHFLGQVQNQKGEGREDRGGSTQDSAVPLFLTEVITECSFGSRGQIGLLTLYFELDSSTPYLAQLDNYRFPSKGLAAFYHPSREQIRIPLFCRQTYLKWRWRYRAEHAWLFSFSLTYSSFYNEEWRRRRGRVQRRVQGAISNLPPLWSSLCQQVLPMLTHYTCTSNLYSVFCTIILTLHCDDVFWMYFPSRLLALLHFVHIYILLWIFSMVSGL